MGKKLLWIGDAVRPTGFECVSRNVLTQLREHGWDVHQLGINFHGDPPVPEWPTYPASLGGDLLGIGRVADVVGKVKPDLVCILGDSWVIPHYFAQMPPNLPVAAYIPVDAPNQAAAAQLQRLQLAIAYTKFGAQELRVGGYQGRLAVIPHGVDLTAYYPVDKKEARKTLGMNESQQDAFIVGNVNRNQVRKRLDLSIMYFAEWWRKANRPNAYLLLHCQLEDAGWDLIQLARYFGILDRMIFTGGRGNLAFNPLDRMKLVYSALDLQISTGHGEGWGLTHMEGMACKVPQLLPRYSALAEWADGAANFVLCTDFEATFSQINTIGGTVNKRAFIDALHTAYNFRGGLGVIAERGFNLVHEDRFTWRSVGERFNDELGRLL